MPTYVYLCNRCKHEFEVTKSIRELDDHEACEECGLIAERVIRFSGGLDPDNKDTYFHYALGKTVRSKADVRNELARVKGETGREFIEVGNDQTKPKKREVKYDDHAMIQAYKQELKRWQ